MTDNLSSVMANAFQMDHTGVIENIVMGDIQYKMYIHVTSEEDHIYMINKFKIDDSTSQFTHDELSYAFHRGWEYISPYEIQYVMPFEAPITINLHGIF